MEIQGVLAHLVAKICLVEKQNKGVDLPINDKIHVGHILHGNIFKNYF